MPRNSFLRWMAGDAHHPVERTAAIESLRIRAAQSVHAQWPMTVATAVAIAGFAWGVSLERALLWGLPLIVMALVNAHVSRGVLQGLDEADLDGMVTRQHRLWWMTIVNQLLVGSTVWWMGWHAQAPGGAAVAAATTLQLIYCIGALINASTHPHTFIPGVWINLGLAAAYWAGRGPTGWALGIGMLGIALLLTRFAYQIQRDFEESIRMRFENLDLVQQLEKEKRAAQEANLAKSRFLAAASHDLRQPLHALMMFVKLLDAAPPQERPDVARHIRASADTLDRLFADLLDLSKLDAGAVKPTIRTASLRPLVESLDAEFRPKCQAKGLHWQCQVRETAVETDAFLLGRVLRNLLDNAVKYTDRGRVSLEIEGSGDDIRLHVRDTGPGIPVADQTLVFEEFYQVDNEVRDAARGSGLGLAIVKRLCELMGHQLEMRSADVDGTCFTLHLRGAAPVRRDDAPAASPATAEPAAALSGRRVWLVEDNESVRLATTATLTRWGCVVHPMEDGQALSRALGEQRPEALIVDYRLPGGRTGLDLVREVRRRCGSVPAAIITGDQFVQDLPGVKEEALPVFQKPVTPEDLRLWLEAALTSGAPSPSTVMPSRAQA